MEHNYSYQAVLEAQERVSWRVEDLIGDDKPLDFSKRFLPEALARVDGLHFLSDEEKVQLNQIRGNGYLHTFGLVEEFILPFVMDHARPHLDGDDYRTRAFLEFAAEEAKHIHLFKRFAEEFKKGFPVECGVIGPADEISRAVLAHHPLAVAMVVLHIEWMTQAHYVAGVKDNQSLDSQFANLLKHHWMEEVQHAKLDTMMVMSLADACTAEEIDRAFEDYMSIGTLLDNGLAAQMEMDIEALRQISGRRLSDAEEATYCLVQQQALRWTYLGSGMTHPNFLATVEGVKAGAKAKFAEISPGFC